MSKHFQIVLYLSAIGGMGYWVHSQGAKKSLVEKVQLFCLCVFAVGALWTNFLTQMGYFLGLMLWGAYGIRQGFVWRQTPFDWPLLIFVLVTIVTSLTGVDVPNSLGGLPKTLGWMGIFVWVIHVVEDPKTLRLMVWLLVISAVTQSLYGLWTWKYRPDLLEPGSYEGWMRIYGTMSHPIFLGEGLAMVAAVGMAWFLAVKSSRWGLALGALPLGWCLALTYARGAWMGMAAVGLMLARWGSKRYWAGLVILGLVGGAVVYRTPNNFVVKRLRSITSQQDASVSERLGMWKTGAKIIRDHPFGVGVHNAEQVSKIYLTDKAHKGFPILHSNLMQLAVERGVLGLVAFLWLSAGVVWYLTGGFRLRLTGELSAVALGAAAAYVAFFVSGLTEYNYGTQRIVMLMWFLLGMGCSAIRLNKQNIG